MRCWSLWKAAEVDRVLDVVAALRFEEDDRIVGLDGLLDHPVGVVGVRAADDFEAGGVREVGLGRLGVVFDGADPTPERDPDHHRHRRLAAGAHVHLRHLGDDLREAREDEAVELDLEHRAVAAHAQSDGGADDARLGQRRVDHAVLAELGLEPLSDPEDAAELSDVLAREEHLRVGLECAAQPPVEGLCHRQRLAHASSPAA